MFGAVIMEGTPKTGLALATRRGTAVPNEQRPPEGEVQLWTEYLQTHQALQFEQRRAAIGIYNCAGLVWANRRTSIFDADMYEKFLAEDGYTKLAEGVLPDRGDVAVYRFRHNHVIWHVGLVVDLRTEPASFMLGQPSIRVPYVLSKWSDWGGETYHHANRFPEISGCSTVVEYWSDR